MQPFDNSRLLVRHKLCVFVWVVFVFIIQVGSHLSYMCLAPVLLFGYNERIFLMDVSGGFW